jgi:hypothetical protein
VGKLLELEVGLKGNAFEKGENKEHWQSIPSSSNMLE